MVIKQKLPQKYDIDKKQCDKIIKHSKKSEHQSYPLYFLYQHMVEEDLKERHFSFLDDFENELSGITFSSAYNIQNLIEKDKLKFSDIHENKIKHKWKNQVFDLFENNEKVGLPVYLFYTTFLQVELKNFRNLSIYKATFWFFLFFPFGDDP